MTSTISRFHRIGILLAFLLVWLGGGARAVAQSDPYELYVPVPDKEEPRDYPLGPIGGQYRLTDKTAYARIVSINAGGPGAAVGLKVGDLIVGAFGKKFPLVGVAPNGELIGDHHGVTEELGFAVDRAEGADGRLPLQIVRPGVGSLDVVVQLSPVGAFGATFPVASPKFDETYEKAVKFVHDDVIANNGPDWYFAGWYGLILMGHPDWNQTTGTRPYRVSINMIRDWSVNSINSETYAATESVLYDGSPNPKAKSGSSNWGAGARIMFLAEYYARTKLTDSPEMVAKVRAALQRATEMFSNNIQWWKQPSLTGPNGYSPSGPDIAGMISHGGVEGDYIHLGWGGGINEPGGAGFIGMSFARRAGMDMSVRPMDGHYFGYTKAEFQSMLNTPGSKFYGIQVVEPGKELYDHSLEEKFRMYWRTRGYRNAGFSSPGDLYDGHTTYQFEGWNPHEALGKTGGTIVGMMMYQQDGGQLTTEDTDRLNRMKLFVTRNYMRVQNSHAYCVGAQAQHTLSLPFLSDRQQRFVLDNWRFFYALGRDENRNFKYFRSRYVNDNYLSEQRCMAVNYALPWTVLNNRISLLPATSQNSLVARFDNPDMRWPDLYARHIKSTSKVVPMPVVVLNGTGAIQASSAYTKTWNKVSGPGNVTFGSDNITFGSDGYYRVKLAITQGTTVIEEPIDVLIQSYALPEGYVAGSANYSVYKSIHGSSVASLTNDWKFPNFPDEVRIVSSAKGTVGGDAMGSRLSGVIIAPATGTYRFYIASDDSSELRINTTGLDGSVGSVVASVSSGGGYWVQPPAEDFAQSPSQRSVEFQLTEGQAIGFEALQKNEDYGNHLSVGWSINGSSPSVIPGASLARHIPSAPRMAFLTHPQSVRTTLGANVTLSVDVVGPSPAAILWRRNGKPIEGAISTTLNLNNIAAGSEGEYDCTFTTADGTIASEKARVSIVDVGVIATGALWQELYTSVGGERVSDLTSNAKFPYLPDQSGPITTTATADLGDNYGERWSGWITPPQTANYRFYVAADDVVELWLSSDDSVANATKIVERTAYCGVKQWSGNSPSAYIPLQAGRRYYIQVLHKEGGGGDHCSVNWQREGDPNPTDGSGGIPSSALSYRKGGLYADTLLANFAPGFEPTTITGRPGFQGLVYSGVNLSTYAVDTNSKDLPTLAFVKVTGPSWLQVASDGALSGTPGAGDVGANEFTVRVTDSGGLSGQATLRITVNPPNSSPSFTANPTLRAAAVSYVAYTGQTLAGSATDANAWDVLTYSKVSGPDWLAVAPDGTLSGIPHFEQAGVNEFQVRVTDLAGASATTTLRIVVDPVKVAFQVNGAPVESATLNGPNKGDNVVLSTAVFRGMTVINSVEYYVNGTLLQSSSSSPFTVTWPNVQPGNYVLQAKVKNSTTGYSTYDLPSVTVHVEDPPVVATRSYVATSIMAAGKVLGSASAAPGAGRSITGWTLLNETQRFSINASGVVSLLQPGSLPSQQVVTLKVRATDNLGVTADGAVNILCNPPVLGGANEQRWVGSAAFNGSDWTSQPVYSGILNGYTPERDVADEYSRRITGRIQAPTTGDYTFWMTCDDQARLYLSPDDSEANKVKIIQVDEFVPFQNWDSNLSVRSASIRLQAGKVYWLEVHHREGGGGDHVTVAWSGPGITRRPIADSDLFPPQTVSDWAWVGLNPPTSVGGFLKGQTLGLSTTVVKGTSPISRVEFYSGTTLIGSDSTEPYSFDWQNLPHGTLTLTAKAVTASGTVTSEPVTIQVEFQPQVAPQVFVATRWMPVGTVIGDATAEVAPGRTLSSTGWSITSGNSLGAFAMSPSGRLTLANPTALTGIEVISLGVRALDSTGKSGDGVFSIIANPPRTRGVAEDRWSSDTYRSYPNVNWAGLPQSSATLGTFTQRADGLLGRGTRRLSGYLQPSVSGVYYFHIASTDQSELYLSSNEQAAGLTKIAYESGYRDFQSFSNDGTTKSAAITLQAGKVYFMEVRHWNGGYFDHVSVGWTPPGATTPVLIPASAIFPTKTVTDPAWVGIQIDNGSSSQPAGAPFTLAATVVDGTAAVTSVDFYRGTTKIGSSSQKPFQFVVPGLVAGAYTFSAKAIGSGSAVLDESLPIAVTVLVNNAPDADADGDGFISGLETYLGTDPQDPASYPSSIYSGMVGWWRLDEGTGVSLSNVQSGGPSGTLNGANAWRGGVSRRGLDLNGVDTYLTFGDGATLIGAQDFTASVWVKVEAGTPQGRLVQQRGANVDGQYNVDVLADGRVKFNVYNSGDQFNLTTTQTINDGRWHLLTAVREGVQGRIYIDKVLATSGSGSSAKALANNPFVVGRDQRDSNSYFRGAIDEIRLYHRALSTAEVGTLFDEPARLPTPPLFGADPINGGYAEMECAYSFNISTLAIDPNTSQGDVLTFTRVSGPAWMTLSTGGVVSGVPTSANLGANDMVVRVTDAAGQHADAVLSVTVSPQNYWKTAAGGSWATAGNWNANRVPSGTEATAYFDGLDLTSALAVTLDGARTVGKMVFRDTVPSHNMTLSAGTGGAALTLDAVSPEIRVDDQMLTLNLVVAGSKGLRKTGAGTLLLSGVNTYSGDTIVEAGTLAADQARDGFNSSVFRGSIIVRPGATLAITNSPFGWGGGLTRVHVDGGLMTGNAGFGFGTVIELTGGLMDSVVRYDLGRYNSVDGRIQSWASATRSIIRNSGGLFLRGDSGQTSYELLAEAGTTTDGIDLEIVYSINELSTCGIVKGGAGTVLLSGSSSYTGATLVNAGTLLVNGSLASGTTTTVGASGTLGGVGTLNGPVIVNGSLAPGGSNIGTLTIKNTLNLAGNALFGIAKNGRTLSNDQIAGATSVAAGGSLTVSLKGDPLVEGDSFTLFNVAPTGSFASVSLPTLPSYLKWQTTDNYKTISVLSNGTRQPNTISAFAAIAHQVYEQGLTVAVQPPTASSGLPVVLSIKSGPATISGDVITVTGPGMIVVAANQFGNATYYAAAEVTTSFAAIGPQILGALWKEIYSNVGGNTVSSLTSNPKYPNSPDQSGPITSAATPSQGSNYGQRWTGMVTPPQTGSYRFWVAGDDAVQVWLSTDSGSANKVKIVEITSWTDTKKWSASTPSGYIPLQGGVQYYIEVLHKQESGGDGCAVAWQRQGDPNPVDGTGEIPSSALSYRVGGVYAYATPKQANTISAFATIPNQTYLPGATLTVTVPTASSGLPVTVSVKSGPATIAGSTVTLTGAGTVVLAANQGGSSQFSVAAEVTTSFVVSRGTQSITFPAIADRTYSMPPFTLGATASSGLPVSYQVVSGPATVTGSQIAVTGVGTVLVSATQAGDSNWQPATATQQSFVVSKAAQSITFPAIADRTYTTTPFTLGATASSGLAISYTVSGPATVNGSQITVTGVGTVQVTADQAGNGNWNAASPAQQSFVVSKAPNAISAFASIPTQTYASGKTLTITPPTASSGLSVAVSVASGPATISGNTVTLTGTGTVVLAADQGGDANYLAATRVTTSFAVQNLSGPVVVSRSPVVGTPVVSVASDIVVDFDQDIVAGTGNIVINGGTGDVRAFSVTDATQVSIRSKRLRLNPSADLQPNKAYSVQIASGAVTSASGASYEGITDTTSFTFQTGNVIYSRPTKANGNTAGTGTSSDPYGSLGYASTKAVAGSTIYVQDPSITVDNSYTLTATGTAAAPVVIKPAPGTRWTYRFNSANGLVLDGASNLVIEGFRIEGGADAVEVYDIASNVTSGFWNQTTTVPIGGIAMNIVNATGVVIRDNVFQHLQQKAVNIQNGRYVEVTGNVIRNVATRSLSGGHGIMRQQGSGNFGTADEAGKLRWDITGNLIFNVSQRLYSWVPTKGYLNMTLDEGKPINIDETTDTSLSARISDNLIAYATIDAIRVKPTPNLTVSRNSIYSTGSAADGITDVNTLTGSDRFPGFAVKNNLIMTAPGTFGLEVNDGFPTAAATDRVAGNVLSGGGVNPAGLPGVTLLSGTSAFANPSTGDFSPAAGLPAGVGIDPIVLADLQRKAQADGIVVAPDGWEPDPLKLTQTLLDSVPGYEDGVSGNETVFGENATYSASGREAGRKSMFFTVNSTWQSTKGVPASVLVNGRYEIITPAEYSAWRDGIQAAYPGYTSIRWGDSQIGQNKVFPSGTLFVASIRGPQAYTKTIATGKTITLGGTLLVDFDGYIPRTGDTFDFVQASQILSADGSGFSSVLFRDSTPAGWSYGVSVVTVQSGQVLRLTVLSGAPAALLSQTLGAFGTVGGQTFAPNKTVNITPPTASSGLAVELSVKSGPATLNGTTVTLTGAGTVVLAANQSGNASYAAATEVMTSFVVSKGDQTIQFAQPSAKRVGDAAFNLGATADSGLAVSYAASPAGILTISGSTATIVGAGSVTITASQAGDVNWNAATAMSRTLLVSPASQTTRRFSGAVRYYSTSGHLMQGVTLSVVGGAPLSVVSGSDGRFAVDAPTDIAVDLEPSNDTDTPIANGVTTADIALIRRHVLGIVALDSPQKVLAGDVSGNDVLTTADIGLIRRLILNGTPYGAAGLWRFVPSDESIPDSAAPWTASRKRRYPSPAVGQLDNQDFMAIKLGDVNGSWAPVSPSPTLKHGTVNRSDSKGMLILGKVTVDSGRTAEIPISVADIHSLSSIQFTLAWDPAAADYEGFVGLGDVEIGLGNLGLSRVAEGKLSVSWDNPSGTGAQIANGTVLFRLKIRPKSDAGLRHEIRLVDNPVPLEVAYQGDVLPVASTPGWFEINGSSNPTYPSMALRVVQLKPDGSVQLEVRAQEGLGLVLENSESLASWREVKTVIGEGIEKPVLFEVESQSKVKSAFWRLRAQ